MVVALIVSRAVEVTNSRGNSETSTTKLILVVENTLLFSSVSSKYHQNIENTNMSKLDVAIVCKVVDHLS
jgi:hypothetical protein